MAKLRGKAKAEFLRRMAAGRRKAARARGKAGPSARRKGPVQRRKKRASRRRNPELLVVNPSTASRAKAAAAYRQFHGVNPKKATKLGRGKGVLIALGELREIVYQPRRGNRSHGAAFFHNFKPGNVLATTPDGKKLVIVDRKGRKAVDFDLGIVN